MVLKHWYSGLLFIPLSLLTPYTAHSQQNGALATNTLQPTTIANTNATVAVEPVTVALVQKADVIMVGRVGQLTPGPRGSLVFHLLPRPTEPDGRIKGERTWANSGFSLPAGRDNPFQTGEEVVVFAKYDRHHRVNIVLAGADAKRPASPGLVTQVKSLVTTNPRVTITMGTGATTYRSGEPITLTWEFKNNSPEPVRVCAGATTCQYSYRVNGIRFSGSEGGYRAPEEADFQLLAPGESFIYRHTIPMAMAAGQVPFEMTYSCEPNWLEFTSATRRFPGSMYFDDAVRDDVLFADESRSIVINITDP
ncbi:MAG: hypothetical protein JO316_14290 [Abitibacteriaceae bacterium]|nr:hypothetical protein [Abditibacteriaceae bacterium]